MGKTPWRDRFAEKVANWVLTTFATTEYLTYLYLVNKLGRKEVDNKCSTNYVNEIINKEK